MALHRYDSKERLESIYDSLFLCEGDHLPILAENKNIWKQYGDYETAANYCRSKNSKKGSNRSSNYVVLTILTFTKDDGSGDNILFAKPYAKMDECQENMDA